MSEQDLWHTTKKLSIFGTLHRIENKIALGTPDVAYCLRLPVQQRSSSGWLELKYKTKFPLGPLVIDHLTQDQIIFAKEWSASGGMAHFLLQVGRAYFLLNWETASKIRKREMTEDGIRGNALVVSDRGFPTAKLMKYLTA